MVYEAVFSTSAPRMCSAFFASSSSCAQSGPFIATNTPPTFTKGRHSSHRVFKRATALDVAISNAARSSAGASSALACRHETSPKPNLSQVSDKNSIRLFRLSSSVSLMLGSAIFRASPGNPAPVPTSMTVFSLKSVAESIAELSRKCCRATAFTPLIAVKFMTELRSSRYSK